MLRRTRATAPLGALAASVALSGCGAAGPVEEGAAAAAVTAETATATADGGAPGGAGTGVKAAPGVLPPTGEPKPGEARLNADGYYDYTADDFELGEPCSPEIVARAKTMGYEELAWPEDFERPGEFLVCGLMGIEYDMIMVYIDPYGAKENRGPGAELRPPQTPDTPWYIVTAGMDKTGTCTPLIDTPTGSRGILVGWGPYTDITTEEAACELAEKQLKQFILGD